MELIDTMLIERIRKALIKRYDRDQQIQQMIEEIGADTLNYILVHGSIFQPVIAALTGFIPNCAASVILSQLYLDQVLSFGSLFAGLMTSTGLGLLVLLRMYDNKKDILRIVLIMFVSATIIGIFLQLF